MATRREIIPMAWTRWTRRIAPLVLGMAGLMDLGCGEAEPPEPSSDEMQKAEQERKEIIKKEYGGGAPPKARPRAR
jgi:hypothetical protein